MTREEFVAIVMDFPGVEEGLSWGQPSFKLRGTFFTRWREEDDSALLMGVSFDERELLLEAEPETFFLTPHHQKFPVVLARLATLDPDQLRAFLERRWRKLATKAMAKARDAVRPE